MKAIIILIFSIFVFQYGFSAVFPHSESVSASMEDCVDSQSENNPILKVKKQFKLRNKLSVSNAEETFNYQVCNTHSYGELEELLGENIFKVDSLVVNGPVGHVDIKAMWNASLYGRLKVINLENADIENNSIPNNAFYDQPEQLSADGQYIDCISLKRIILPDAVTYIGDCAFLYAINLEDIIIPSSLQYIGEYAFSDCISLRTDPLIFPEGLEKISNLCFLDCKSLTGTVILPQTLKEIGTGAFYGSKISSINFPYGLETLGEAAFYATHLKEVILPSTCLNFKGSGHFGLCGKLKKIHLPEGMQSIPVSFAYCCISLEEIKMPSTIKSIGHRSFDLCKSLKQLDLPEGLESIGGFAFRNVSDIMRLCLPSTLKYIGAECFYGLDNIVEMYCAAPVPPICGQDDLRPDRTPFGPYGSSYGKTPPDTPVYVPYGAADIYRSSWGWHYFTIFIETDDFPSVGTQEIPLDNSPNDHRIYDIYGRPVQQMQKGNLYIKDGKKYICRK